MRITSSLAAEPGTVFGPRAFQGQIGEAFILTMLDGRQVPGVIADAVVSEDGMNVTLTMDVPDL